MGMTMTMAALTLAVAAAACGPPAQMAPAPPANDCESGTLAQCAASCRAHADGACDDLGKRTCTEGSLLECQASCDGGNAGSCNELGEIYDGTDRVALDQKKAVSLFARACDMGRLASCTRAGDLADELLFDEDPVGDPAQSTVVDPSLRALAIHSFAAGCDLRQPEMGELSEFEDARIHSGNACAGLLQLAPEQILPTLDARCAAPPPPPPPRGEGRERADPCAIVAGAKTATNAERAAALRNMCARDPRSGACGKLKDMGVLGRQS
jgi:hypothetical protein